MSTTMTSWQGWKGEDEWRRYSDTSLVCAKVSGTPDGWIWTIWGPDNISVKGVAEDEDAALAAADAALLRAYGPDLELN